MEGRSADERREIRTTRADCGGLAVLPREVLRTVGIDVDNVFYEGWTYGPGEGVHTRLQMVVPNIPGRPRSLMLRAATSEGTFSRAVQTIAMRILRLATLVYQNQLSHTRFRYLPRALEEPADRDAVSLLAHAADRERNVTLRTSVQCMIEQEYLNIGLEEKVAKLREKVWKQDIQLLEKDNRIALLEKRLEAKAREVGVLEYEARNNR